MRRSVNWIILKYHIWSRRSQWQRGLRHELASLAQTLGSWVRIPLKAWMSVLRTFILFLVVLCVCRGLINGWSPVQGVLPTLYRIKKLKKRPRPKTKGCRAIIITIIIYEVSWQTKYGYPHIKLHPVPCYIYILISNIFPCTTFSEISDLCYSLITSDNLLHL
jgi:hypothetical protein